MVDTILLYAVLLWALDKHGHAKKENAGPIERMGYVLLAVMALLTMIVRLVIPSSPGAGA